MVTNKRTVEGYLGDVAQIFAGVGTNDPHMYVLGKVENFLSRQLHAYARSYLHKYHVRPVPIALLHECWHYLQTRDAHQCAINDLIYVAFFFLFWTGKYCNGETARIWPPSVSQMFNFSLEPAVFAPPLNPCWKSTNLPYRTLTSTLRRTWWVVHWTWTLR